MDALSVQDNADQLRSRLNAPSQNDWESDADLMQRVRDQVNDMDKLLSQLLENQAGASPWQQREIERITPTLVNLTDTTQDAIVTLNNHQGHPYFSNLPGLAGDIYNQASRIGDVVGNFEKYANARHEVRQLQQTLGLKSNS
jgi:hypothetical protein